MRALELPKRIAWKFVAEFQEPKYREITKNYNIAGHKRFYLVHIRKTGGVSLTNMFLSLGQPDYQSVYRELLDSRCNRIVKSGKVFVGWNRRLINKGNYFFAFSHIPWDKLRLPPNTFTISCFRDPVRRIISHHSMLMNFLINKIPHPCMREEGKWLGNSFDDFIDRIPKKHLLNQLYMFSKDFNINQAIDRIKKLSFYFFTEDFEEGIGRLNSKTGLNLQPIHILENSYKASISETSKRRLKEMLEDEYLLLDQLGSES